MPLAQNVFYGYGYYAPVQHRKPMLEVKPTAKLVETGACISFYHHHGDIVLRVRFRGEEMFYIQARRRSAVGWISQSIPVSMCTHGGQPFHSWPPTDVTHAGLLLQPAAHCTDRRPAHSASRCIDIRPRPPPFRSRQSCGAVNSLNGGTAAAAAFNYRTVWLHASIIPHVH